MTSQLLRGALRLAPNLARQPLLAVPRYSAVAVSFPKHISTSKKNRDVTATVDPNAKDTTNVKEEKKDKKNWVSYGYDWETEEEDLNNRNAIMFLTVTCAMVVMSFGVAYFPDVRNKNWIQREAYIELARREALGLPHIDENLIPLDQINLPTEEELGDFEIII